MRANISAPRVTILMANRIAAANHLEKYEALVKDELDSSNQ
jgi:hypothetical protein